MPASGNFRRAHLALLAAAFVAGNTMADVYAPVNEDLRNGQWAQAMAKTKRHLARHPRDARMLFLKGLAQQESGRHAEAIATYTRLARDHPGLPEPWHNLATIHAGQGRPDQARQALEMAARASRSQATIHEHLGHVYAHLAMSAYRQALQLEDKNNALDPPPVPMRQLIAVPTPMR
jgi:tetratricopeptide (TPR) repeat protein